MASPEADTSAWEPSRVKRPLYFRNVSVSPNLASNSNMANETQALPLVYQCVFCDWRWDEENPETYNTEYDAAIVFVGAGACPACVGPMAIQLKKAS
jgi:hypothetical protein